jgi:hypothetical protein
MKKKSEDRRNQPEFFFVFNSQCNSANYSRDGFESMLEPVRGALCPDVAKSHRDRLIEELREFGC